MFSGCIVQSGRGREWVDTTAPGATIEVEMEPGHLRVARPKPFIGVCLPGGSML